MRWNEINTVECSIARALSADSALKHRGLPGRAFRPVQVPAHFAKH